MCLAINLFRSCCISAIAVGCGRVLPSGVRGRTVASNPGGIEANLFGVNRLVEDVGNELVRGLRIVLVVIAAQCKIHCLFYQR